MGKFVQKITITKDRGDGDTLVFVVAPMTKAAALQLHTMKRVPVLDEKSDLVMDPETGRAQTTLSDESIMQLVDSFGTHVESIAGARDAGGGDVSKETILNTAYYFGVLVEAAGEWSARSLSGN